MLNNMKIGLKLGLGFGSLLIIAIVLSLVGISTVNELNRVIGLAHEADAILMAELESKGARKDFLLSGSQEDKQLFMKYIAEMETGIAQMRQLTKKDEVVRRLDSIESTTGEYKKTFERVTQVADFS
ncbi:hypothetical protein K8I28_02195, partial [bacterium]|nr:hypothetical protein [bacterium]